MAKKINFSEITTAVDQGQIGLAQKRLFELKAKLHLFSRPERATYAKLARRAELPELCLSVLKSYFIAEDTKQLLAKPTEDEMLQYGVSLINLGAYAEGLKILDRINTKEMPQSLYFKAFALMRRSQWKEVLPIMEEYCKSSQITDDQRAWGHNYLAQAYSIGFFDGEKADKILAGVQKTLSPDSQGMLYNNTLLLRVQAATVSKRYTDASKFVSIIESKGDLTEGSYYHTSLMQWKILADAELKRQAKKNSKPDPAVIAKLREISEYFHKTGHWENSRTCQIYLAQYSEDLELFRHLYLGTPYPGYRERIEKMVGSTFEFQNEYWVNLPTFAADQSEVGKIYNLWEKKRSKWNPPVIPQKLFEYLLADFFKPQRTAEILSALFPNEQYLPLSTPNRIHQLLHRLKSSFKEAKLPITIEHRAGAFFLSTVNFKAVSLNVPTSLLLNQSRATRPTDTISNPAANAFETFKRHIRTSQFSLEQLQTQFDISKRTSHRWVEQWINSGWVNRTESGYTIIVDQTTTE
jgi:hypothetical protein